MNFVHRRGTSILVPLSRTVAGILLTLAAQTSLAGTFRALSPATYVRDTAAPQEQHLGFAVRNPAVPYRLHIDNGGDQSQYPLVASAVVTLNGNVIFGPNDFNASKSVVLDAPVTLTAVNDLSVELRGQPGGGLTVSVIGEDTDRPTIAAVASPAANAAGWANSPVTVNFTCNDLTSEISQCSAPVTLSNDRANQSVSGTAIDGAGNSASTTLRVSIDQSGPVITLANVPAAASTTSLNISGTITDALPGAVSVNCNGAAAVLSAGSFQCSVTLTSGINIVNVDGTDAAGNTTRQSASIMYD